MVCFDEPNTSHLRQRSDLTIKSTILTYFFIKDYFYTAQFRYKCTILLSTNHLSFCKAVWCARAKPRSPMAHSDVVMRGGDVTRVMYGHCYSHNCPFNKQTEVSLPKSYGQLVFLTVISPKDSQSCNRIYMDLLFIF